IAPDRVPCLGEAVALERVHRAAVPDEERGRELGQAQQRRFAGCAIEGGSLAGKLSSSASSSRSSRCFLQSAAAFADGRTGPPFFAISCARSASRICVLLPNARRGRSVAGAMHCAIIPPLMRGNPHIQLRARAIPANL